MKHGKKTKGLFIGRFQPYHKGHETVVKTALGRKGIDFLVIAIGSSEESGTRENPFSFEERKNMIEASIPEKYIKKYSIIRIPDMRNDEKWARILEKRAGKFQKIYTRNPWVSRIFRKFSSEKYSIIKPAIKLRMNATAVRQEMARNGNWKKLVPKGTADVINKIKGVERVRKIYYLNNS